MVMRPRVSVRAWVILGAVALAFLGTASAHASNTLTVCPAGPPECQFQTVQEALDAAQTGDRILIAPGTYAAGFRVAKSVSLIGSGQAETTLSGGQVAVTIAAGVTVEVDGLTISDGGDTGLVNGGTLTVTDSTVANSRCASRNGPACGVWNAGTLTLLHSTVRNNVNVNGSDVGGIKNDGQLTMRDSAVVANHGFEKGGLVNEGSAAITRSVLRSNGGDHWGNIQNEGHLVLRDSLVADGSSNGSGALTNTGVAVIVHTVLRDNSGTSGAGAIGNSGSLTISRSILRGNTSEDIGGGIANAGVLVLRYSRVTGNTAWVGGGINNTGSAELSHSVVNGNTAHLAGGGINNSGTLTLRHSTVRGNIPDDCVGCAPLATGEPASDSARTPELVEIGQTGFRLAPGGGILQPSLAFTLRPVPFAG
jgi:hypothetical protein